MYGETNNYIRNCYKNTDEDNFDLKKTQAKPCSE